VLKVRSSDGHIAVDIVTFVDDVRPSGPMKWEGWQAAWKMGYTLSYLGLQDAARKRRDSSQASGAWAGGVVRTNDGGSSVLVSQDKWKKIWSQVKELREMLEKEKEGTKLSRKRLEQIRGYVGHVVQVYHSMKPYLIGIHMTIDGCRYNRDADGWKLPASELAKVMVKEGDGWMEKRGCQEVPPLVWSVSRLEMDVRALEVLVEPPEPPLRPVRCQENGTVLYGFGDASGQVFGSTFQILGDKIHYQYGQWPAKVTEEELSNWRELGNLVGFVTNMVEERDLRGFELFIFTDNSTAENAFWKGTSTSPRLCDLALKLRKLEQKHGLW
jgi:hypothetical protein